MKRTTILLALLLFVAMLSALTYEIELDTARWQDRNIYQVNTADIGAPAVPYYPLRIVLPYGHKLGEVTVEFGAQRDLRTGVELDYIRQSQPASQSLPDQTVPRTEIYRAATAYPAQDYELLGTQYYRGVQIAVINIYPFKYNPVSRELLLHNSFTIELETTFNDTEAAYQARYLGHSASREDLVSSVANPQELFSYDAISPASHNPQSRLIDLSTPRKMIIITDQSRLNWFNEYAAWRSSLGVSTGIFSTADIYDSYPGVDNAEKVRNFIIDAYLTWLSEPDNLEYVILGGDDEIVPERGAFGQVGSTVDQRMPVDLYYGCLDGTWNANNNQIWGEYNDDVDMVPELHVSRFPAETLPEFNNIMRKIRYYVDNDTFSNNISIMYGENLNNNPLTWGGDYKDDVMQYIPDSYEIFTHYQRDGTYNETIVWNSINQGANVMNHMGHANETFLMGQSNNSINQLQNTEYGFLYSQGCYPAAFDQRTSGDGESIAEHLLMASGALMGFVGNTRYGWYMPGGIDGASQYYDRKFFVGLYEEDLLQQGKALSFSRLENLNAAMQSGVMRWCYFEQVLFGDPSVELKLPDPDMPLLSLESYHFTDEEGDNDGILNPGEIIRFYPVVRNAPGWGEAQNVSVSISGLPAGADVLSGCPVFPSLPSGTTSSTDTFVRIQLPQNMDFGIYTIKVDINATHSITGALIGNRRFNATFEITLMDSRFPWDNMIGSKSAPIVADLDDEEGLDIIYLDSQGRSYLIGNDGESYLDFAPDEQQNIMRSTAMGNINGDIWPDVVVASRTGYVYAVDTQGVIVMDYMAPTPFIFTPVLADFDNDGLHEVVLGGLDGKIYLIDNDGSLAPGFPLDLGSTFNSELAVATFGGNTSPEIIAGTVGGMLYRIDANGGIHPDYPIDLDAPITGSPVITQDMIFVGTSNAVYKISNDGSPILSRPIVTSMAGGAVLGNILYNGKRDLAFVTLNGMLYAMDEDLQDISGFPVNVGVNFSCPPLLADLEGDSRPEIILHSYINSVFIYDHAGNSLEGFPFVTSYNGSTPATLTEFDNDGFLKLVSGYSTGVMMVNLRRPVGSQMQWVTYRGDLTRQGNLEITGFVSNDDQISPPAGINLTQNYPNPFSGSTSIDYRINKAGQTSLEIFNLRGQLVRRLVHGAKVEGSHSVQWDGRDARGQSVASGVYTYRLHTAEGSQTRKMLLIRN